MGHQTIWLLWLKLLILFFLVDAVMNQTMGLSMENETELEAG